MGKGRRGILAPCNNNNNNYLLTTFTKKRHDDLYQLTGRFDMAMAAALCLASSGLGQGRPLYL